MRLNIEDAVEQYLEQIDSDKTSQPTSDTHEFPLPPQRKPPLPREFLPIADVLLSFVAFGLAYIARYDLTIFRPVLDPSSASFAPYLPYAAVYAAMLYLIYHGNGLYRTVRGRSLMEEAYIVSNGVATATVILLAMFFVFQPLVTSRLMLVYVAAITIGLLVTLRVIHRMILAHLRSKGIGVQRVLIVGAGETGQAVLRVMMARKDLGYHVVGYVDDNPDRGNVDLGRVKGLGNLENLRSTIRKHHVDLVVVTLPWSYHDRILSLVRTARKTGIEVRAVPDVFQLNLRQVHVENLDGIPLLGIGGGERRITGTDRLIKRLIDLGLIILALPVLLVLFIAAAIIIWIDSPGPVFYTARRVGEGGREFDMFKFRSMIPEAEKYREQLIEATGEDPRHPKIKNDPRVTRVGAFIRATSIDELPQLINVLRGEMSLVGPRPPTPAELQLYQPWHRQRLQAIPGMTGLWQVSGRSDVPFDEMCLLDIYYVENWSVRLDLQILVMTLPRVLLRQGAY
ncbi:MAG: sugar transferase [Anaerolineae bacterium]|nr:sugar transferase [Anaerolineae bacterium]